MTEKDANTKTCHKTLAPISGPGGIEHYASPCIGSALSVPAGAAENRKAHLLLLAERCEREEPSKLLDAYIGAAVGVVPKMKNINRRGHYIGGKPVVLRMEQVWPRYTSSLDAAVTLYREKPERGSLYPMKACAAALRALAHEAPTTKDRLVNL